MPDNVIAVLGVGPGLGRSIAHRFGAEGYTVALVSRSADRHAGYLAELAAAGVTARAYPADLTDPVATEQVIARIRADLGGLDVLYFGPAAAGADSIVPLPAADAAAVRKPLDLVLLPAVTAVAAALPTVRAILLAGGLSGLRPMPVLGTLAPASAALRMYALTLHESLKDQGVYVGALTIGGLVAGGDIHRAFAARKPGEGAEAAGADTRDGQADGKDHQSNRKDHQADTKDHRADGKDHQADRNEHQADGKDGQVAGAGNQADAVELPSLDPDAIAATAWQMTIDRTIAESVFEAPLPAALTKPNPDRNTQP
ncbi:hypothetical protein GCM10010168_35590 [Actinoplanes ianthinogenes]|uniref:Short-chain dehydrogenase n=1 Tax=Actinoplanes ianthinogenes TaxID=122358 RepID=A0ABN6CNX2_9ACTN|nr:SDR family NAD(P)-dependent oxidoreductase [Actinoplanes ianthinogenes]BCJ46921.1 hypothetical protein Aiant_75780 [Actinoplanes ianthinogenes]GGR14624.1 hypothetical protein GCM10010168_35590 [Actinoplanes ianthinogenes]